MQHRHKIMVDDEKAQFKVIQLIYEDKWPAVCQDVWIASTPLQWIPRLQ